MISIICPERSILFCSSGFSISLSHTVLKSLEVTISNTLYLQAKYWSRVKKNQLLKTMFQKPNWFLPFLVNKNHRWILPPNPMCMCMLTTSIKYSTHFPKAPFVLLCKTISVLKGQLHFLTLLLLDHCDQNMWQTELREEDLFWLTVSWNFRMRDEVIVN